MFVVWLYFKRPEPHAYLPVEDAPLFQSDEHIAGSVSSVTETTVTHRRSKFHDLVDIDSVDLFLDEYKEDAQEVAEEEEMAKRLESPGLKGVLWALYHWLV